MQVAMNEMLGSPAVKYIFAGLIILLGMAAIGMLVRRVRLRGIRSRLTAAFMAVAVVPLVIAAVAASSIGTKSTEDSALQLLTTVIDLKHTAVENWLAAQRQSTAYLAADGSPGYSPTTLLTEPVGTQRHRLIADSLQARLIEFVEKNKDLQEVLIVNAQGKVVLSTDQNHAGLELGEQPFFKQGLDGETIHPIQTVDALGGSVLLVSQPLTNNDQSLGALIGSASLDSLSNIIQTGGEIGQTGRVYLVASDFTQLSHLLVPGADPDRVPSLNRATIDAILGKQQGAGRYKNSHGAVMIGAYRWLPDVGAAIIAEQTRSEIYSPALMTIVVNSAISLVLVIGAVIFGLLVSKSIGKPLESLIGITQRVATGDLSLEAEVSRRDDEISILARSFNQMTQNLRSLVGNLEQRVNERTVELEARNEQLVIAAQVNSAITSILDVNDLAAQVVSLIRDRFNLYYVGLFLVDNLNQYAVLKAGTGDAGQEMLARRHRIKIGEGMIGWSILNSRARIAQQASLDPVRLAIPFLPDTQSEAAIPLRSRGQVIGAFTVQSDHPDAFDETSLSTFQILADQVAVAIDNARLFEEVQHSLETTRRAYGELSRKAWLERIRLRPLQAVCNEQGVSVDIVDSRSQNDVGSPQAVPGNGTLHLPIKVRGAAIGYLYAQKPETAGHWSEEEREMLDTLTDQLGVALESARLFEETITRAERERLISQAANRVRQTLDLDTVLKTAILEMQAAMDLQEVEVRLLNEPHLEGSP